MGMRGPKPVDVNRLQADATAWASLFYTLRDGHSGHMQRVKWGPWRNTGSAKWTRMQSGRGFVELPANTRYRQSKPLGPAIHVPVSEGTRMLPEKMKAKDWVIFRPVMPGSEIWSRLKLARSVGEIREASRRMRDWMTREYGPRVGRWLPGNPPLEFADALDLYAEKLLGGIRLPSYARTDRPSSDDKRVVFLSKVLAGARVGLAPITAVKRLSHWDFSRDWAEKPLKEFIDWSEKEFAERAATVEVKMEIEKRLKRS